MSAPQRGAERELERDVARESAPRRFELRPRPGVSGVFDVHVPEGLFYFGGHFPEEPILAGIVQLELLVRRQVVAMWPELTGIARITRLRFRKPIRPGDDLELSIVRAGPSRVEFDIACEGSSCSAGVLHFREPRTG